MYFKASTLLTKCVWGFPLWRPLLWTCTGNNIVEVQAKIFLVFKCIVTERMFRCWFSIDYMYTDRHLIWTFDGREYTANRVFKLVCVWIQSMHEYIQKMLLKYISVFIVSNAHVYWPWVQNLKHMASQLVCFTSHIVKNK